MARHVRYFRVSYSPEDGDFSLEFACGPGLPADFTEWGDEGISMLHKVTDGAGDGVWNGSTEQLITLSVFDPADGTTEISASRSVTTDDAGYTLLTIDKATLDAVGFLPGDMIRLKVTGDRVDWGGAGTYVELRIASFSLDY
jgi:hypothetical protein